MFSASGASPATSLAFAIAALPPTQIAVATPPSGASSNVAFTTQPVVQLLDVNGNPGIGATGPVTVAIGVGGTGVGTLSGTTSVNAVNGVATFTNLKLSLAGTYALTFSSGALPPVTTGVFTVAVSPPVASVITTQPSGAQTGSPLTTQPVVELRDVSGTAVFGATNNVTATLNGAGGVLSGTTTVAAVNGVATFTNLTVTGSGTYSVSFSAAGITSSTSGSIIISPLPPTQLGVSTQPIGGATGSVLPTQPVVQVRDALGSPVVGATNAVTAVLVGGGGVMTGTQTVNAVNGVATFTNLVVTGIGSYTLNFTAAGLASTASGPFTITALPPTQLGIATQPGGAVTGSVLAPQPVVQVRDANGGVVAGATNVVTATLSVGGVLSGTTAVTAVNGVATFTNLLVTGSGTYTITFTSPGLTSAGSQAVVITPLPATQLAVTTSPGTGNTGALLSPQPVVQVRDASNGVVVGATNAVTATLVGGGGVLSGTQTVSAVNGVATFTNLIVTGPGSYTLSFAATGLTTAVSPSFTINALPPTALGIGTQPSGATTGTPLTTQPVIQVKDVNGGVVVAATNNVTAAIASGTGTLSGTTTVAAVNGLATFTNLVITGAGTSTIVFTSTGLTSVTSSSITVGALPPTQLGIGTQPGGAGTTLPLSPQPVVQIRDAGNGVVAGASNVVTATLLGAGGTLGGTVTATAVNGVATFTNLSVTNTAGSPQTYTLQFTSGALTQVVSSAITITALPPTQLGIATQPSGAVTGTAFTTQPVIQVRDQNAAVVAGAANVVTATIASGTGTLTGTLTATAVNGVATFTNLAINGAGNSTITFTAAGLTSATSATIVVSALPPTQLAVGTQPGGAQTGSTLAPQPVVQIRDASNGIVAGATNQVTATLVGGGTLTGTTTVTAVNGVASFTNLVVTGPGSYTLSFTSAGLTAASSASFTITALPATQLAVSTQPVGGSTGAPLTTQPVVQVRDASNGVVAAATNAVTATLNGAGGALTGTVTVSAVNGVATFTNLVVTGPGTYTISFAAAGLVSATSGSITIAALPATKLAISTQPAAVNVVTGTVLSTQPVVQVQNVNSGVVAGATTAVTATLSAGGTLIGTQTVNAVNGIATFTNLAVNAAGTYTLTFGATGLTSTPASASFTILPPFIGLKVNASPTATVTNGSNISIPVIIDMSTAAGQNIASLQFDFNWDPTKFNFVSSTNGSFGASGSFTVNNTTNIATGTVNVAISDNNGFTTGTPTIITIVLQAKAQAAAGTPVAALNIVAGDVNANDISALVTPRTVTVTVP